MDAERDWSAEVQALIDQMTEYYLFPDVAEQVCEVFRRRLADGEYRELHDEEAFAIATTKDAQSVNGDQHLIVMPSEAPLPEQDDPIVHLRGHHPKSADMNGHGFVRIERLPGNVGLVDIRRLYHPVMSGDAAVAAMNLVAGADVLLLDLRLCAGGEPDMVALVSSFLVDERTQLSTLYFPADDISLQYWTAPFVPGPIFGGSKPLYVLTSANTFSAGEGLSYDLQQMGRATLVGETTAGAGNFDYRYRVSERLMFSVPSGYPVNPNSGGQWEGVGVKPDISVDAERALHTAYKLALEHVLDLGDERPRRKIVEQARAALAELSRR